MKEYAMYLRKSRSDLEAEARGEMETLSRHFGILSGMADRMGITVSEDNIFREIVSGESIAARPEVQKLLHNVQQGKYAGVFVVEVERLARGATSDQGIVSDSFRYTHTKIITPVKTYDPDNEFDEEYFEFGLFMSRREYKTINRRMQAGRLQSTVEGNFIGSIAPYGYKKVKRDGYHTLALHEKESKVVRMIVEWFLYGAEVEGFDGPQLLGTTKIANRLNEMGITTKEGRRWSPEKIRTLLLNPVYVGYVKWGFKKTIKNYTDGKLTTSRPRNYDAELYPGKHPAIFTENEYAQIREKFSTNTRKSGGYGANHISNPLAHLLYCQCGKGMSRRTYNGPKQCKSAPRYLCLQQTYCHTKSVAVTDMLKTVYESLLLLKKDTETKLQNQEYIVDTKASEIAEMKSNLAELQATETKLYDYLERGIYDEETFVARRTKLKNEIASLKSLITKKEQERPPQIDYQNRIVKLEDAIVALSDETLSAGTKNAFLRDIIEKIIYYRDDEESYHIDIFLK